MERIYYSINEQTARTAKNINSFREYKEGSATAEYRHYVDKVYEIVERRTGKNLQSPWNGGPHLSEMDGEEIFSCGG